MPLTSRDQRQTRDGLSRGDKVRFNDGREFLDCLKICLELDPVRSETPPELETVSHLVTFQREKTHVGGTENQLNAAAYNLSRRLDSAVASISLP